MISVYWGSLTHDLSEFLYKTEVASMTLISAFIKELSADLRVAFSKCFVAGWELVSCDSVEKVLCVLGHIVKGIFNYSRKYMFIMWKNQKI